MQRFPGNTAQHQERLLIAAAAALEKQLGRTETEVEPGEYAQHGRALGQAGGRCPGAGQAYDAFRADEHCVELPLTHGEAVRFVVG